MKCFASIAHLQTQQACSRSDRNEADGTVILEPGKAIRFDLGFIGRGNPEISKDKVSRFERQLEIDENKYYSATFVVVDRVGDRSTIVEQAGRIGGVIVQMSLSQWPRLLAQELHRRYGFEHEILNMKTTAVDDYLRQQVNRLDVMQFVRAVSPLISDEEDESGN